jgi:hypothetical protein
VPSYCLDQTWLLTAPAETALTRRGSLTGDGVDTGPVDEVVATPVGGKAIIQSALDHYGGIDTTLPASSRRSTPSTARCAFPVPRRGFPGRRANRRPGAAAGRTCSKNWR